MASVESSPKAKKRKVTKAVTLSKEICELKDAMKAQNEVNESLKSLPDTVKALAEVLKKLSQPEEKLTEEEEIITVTNDDDSLDFNDLLVTEPDKGKYSIKIFNNLN